MRVLVVGTGGREHALAIALARDPAVEQVYAAPGNPGIGQVAALHPVDTLDGQAVATLASKLRVDLVVIGPEAPLVAGVADDVRGTGIACFGPSREAAAIEGSKAFAKGVMAAAEIPTALAQVCESAEQAAAALDAFGPPYVVKDDGLAAGKGVLVTSEREAAVAHAARCERVVIEEYLDGEEVSVFAICDGETVLPMQLVQDFKRLLDDDQGPNTGGMGAYTPLPWAPEGLVSEVERRVLRPAVAELARRGSPFVGLLYAGLALTARGLRVVEFNARFGDPETQALLPRLESPLGQVLHAAATGRLQGIAPLQWTRGASVTVVMTAAGYPASPRSGDAITGIVDAESIDDVHVAHAGTTLGPGGLATAGGRVLAVTGLAPDLAAARLLAYQGVEAISFEGAQYRSDIAARAAEPTRPSGGTRVARP